MTQKTMDEILEAIDNDGLVATGFFIERDGEYVGLGVQIMVRMTEMEAQRAAAVLCHLVAANMSQIMGSEISTDPQFYVPPAGQKGQKVH